MLHKDESTRSSQSSAQIWWLKEQRDAAIALKHALSSRVGAHHSWKCLALPIPWVLRSMGQLHEWLRSYSLSKSRKAKRKTLIGNLIIAWATAGWSKSKDDPLTQTDGIQRQNQKADFLEAVRGSRTSLVAVPANGARGSWGSIRNTWGEHWKAWGTPTAKAAIGSLCTFKAHSTW